MIYYRAEYEMSNDLLYRTKQRCPFLGDCCPLVKPSAHTMIPVGYMYKRVITRPDWLKAEAVFDLAVPDFFCLHCP
jgi:hypothetical protein